MAINKVKIGLVVPIYQIKLIDHIVAQIEKYLLNNNLIVCIVNDGKEDVSSYLEQKSLTKNFIVLNLDRNRRFAGANNAGWKYIIKNYPSVKYLGTVNDDTIFYDNWIEKLLEALEGHDDIALTMPIMKVKDKTYATWKLLGSDEMITTKPLIYENTFTSAVNGFCFLAKKQMLEKVGFFDTNYANGNEDIDLGIKLLQINQKLVVVKGSLVEHIGGVSRYIKGNNTLGDFNHKYMAKKYGGNIEKYNNLTSDGYYIKEVDKNNKRNNKSTYSYAAHILAFNVTYTILEAIENCAPYVDKIYISYSDYPWGYNKTAKKTIKNPTTIDYIKQSKYIDKLEFVVGEWDKDEDQRNECVNMAKQDGFDFLIIHDADEFYLKEDYADNLKRIEENPNWDVYLTPWITFWKSLDYVIQSDKNNIILGHPQFAINLNKDVKFLRARAINSKDEFYLQGICYHLSYVMTNDEVHTKIKTWGHAHEFDSDKWYKRKWVNWNINTKYLHPVNPMVWERVVTFNGTYPDELRELAMPIFKSGEESFIESIENIKEEYKLKVTNIMKKIKDKILQIRNWYC